MTKQELSAMLTEIMRAPRTASTKAAIYRLQDLIRKAPK
jgi:hypothetical protein